MTFLRAPWKVRATVSEVSPGRASPDRSWFDRGMWFQILPGRGTGWWILLELWE